MTHCIHRRVKQVEAAHPNAMADRVPVEAEIHQLPSRDNSVLPVGESRHFDIGTSR